MYFLKLDVCICAFALVKFCIAQDSLPYDFPGPNIEDVVCSALNAEPTDMKINLEDTMDYEDAIRLMTWNIKYKFRDGAPPISYGEETEWKRPVLEAIFTIFSHSCPAEYVPRGFLQVMKELNLIYQNSIQNKTYQSENWGKNLLSLAECSDKFKGGDFSGTGRTISKVSLLGRKGNREVVDLLPPQELADGSPHIDLIIDAMWYAFSNAYGACYKKINSRSNSVNNFKKLFIQDFIQPLQDRWLDAGPGVDFGIMIGDFEIDHALLNMRYCVTGTYTKNGLVDRQLTRPVYVGGLMPGSLPTNNRKTGRPID